MKNKNKVKIVASEVTHPVLMQHETVDSNAYKQMKWRNEGGSKVTQRVKQGFMFFEVLFISMSIVKQVFYCSSAHTDISLHAALCGTKYKQNINTKVHKKKSFLQCCIGIFEIILFQNC